MVTQFFDVEDVSAHDEFQAWRTDHLDEAVLTMETRSRANLHGVRCQHFGGSPFFLLEGGGHSLTIKRKICGAEEELLAWASENEIVVNFCHHCVRDKLIRDRGHRAANRTSSKMVEEFNPAIDRYDHRSAARLFDSFWPDPAVSRAVAMNLAASIRAAHMAADGSWEVTMFSDFIRLNVGQVETLTLSKGTIRLFFRAPLELNSITGARFNCRTARFSLRFLFHRESARLRLPTWLRFQHRSAMRTTPISEPPHPSSGARLSRRRTRLPSWNMSNRRSGPRFRGRATSRPIRSVDG